MTSAYCKYGFESGSFGSGTTSSWEYMTVSDVSLTRQTTSQSYNNYSVSDPWSYQVANELNTQTAVSGSFTFYYTAKTMLDFLKAVCWNVPVSDELYIVPITDTSLYSMVIEMGDSHGENEFGYRMSGVVITSLKINCRISDYITVEIGFSAQACTPLSVVSAPSYVERTPKTFLDASYNYAYLTDDTELDLDNLSAFTVTIARSLTESYLIGSDTIGRFYDAGYATVTCDLTYSENEYSTFHQLLNQSTIATIILGIGSGEMFRLDVLQMEGLNQNVSYNLSAAGKTEKTLSFKCGHKIQMDFSG